MDEHAQAGRIAEAAGTLLLELRTGDGGGDPRALRARADAEANRLIIDELTRSFPADAFLSEESKDSGARLGASRVWIVDPLDGTREFGEPGRTDWAVHVALVVDGRPVAGAVALPGRGLTLTTGAAPPLPATYEGPPRLVVSRTRPPAITEPIRAALDGVLVPMGSAGAKAMAIVLGEADVYAHAGGQFEWDSAAPVAVAAAAGLHTSRLDGSPLVYNRPDPYLPDLLICRPELAAVVLGAVGRDAAGDGRKDGP
jgi:3'(2'), 5'-bisphosphate nucleotidase